MSRGRGRRPIGERAMSGAERQRKHRTKRREAIDGPEIRERRRRHLSKWVTTNYDAFCIFHITGALPDDMIIHEWPPAKATGVQRAFASL
jgi:hypothetical protein